MIELEKKYIIEYLQDMLMTFRLCSADKLEGAKYHHNASYDDTPSIIEHGILTINDLVKLNLKNYSEDYLKVVGDTDSHINGDSAVSLSVKGLTDIYPNEWEYDPDKPNYVDIRVSDEVKGRRSTTHYANEFLSYKSISPEMLRSIDIRLLQLINLVKNAKTFTDIHTLIANYNSLIDIANALIKSRLIVPLREKSIDSGIILDTNALANTEKLTLKK